MNALRYFNHVRYDVLAHVPEDVRRVLSIGCGAGRTEALLVERGVDVTGVEIDPEAARAATLAGLNVVQGDVHEVQLSLGSSQFDCLIYADILEHVVDPDCVVREHSKLLSENSVVIISIPNFRHYSVFSQLFVSGHIQYRDAGILDRTHVRITTRRMVQEWFERTGLRTIRVDYRINRRRDKILSFLSFGLLREFLATQVIVVGAQPSSPRFGERAFV